MKLLTIIMLLGLAACGGGSPVTKIMETDGYRVEVTLLNKTNANPSTSPPTEAILTIYSPGAKFVTTTFDRDDNIVSEIFRLRLDDPTKGASIYAENHFDLDGEYHHLSTAAQWRGLNVFVWYKNGIEHREVGDGPSSKEVYGDGTRENYRIDGELHRMDDLPARITITPTGNGSTTKEYYENGVEHRIFGPAYLDLKNGNYTVDTRKWIIDGVVYKNERFQPATSSITAVTYGDFANATAALTAFLIEAQVEGATSTEAVLAWNATE